METVYQMKGYTLHLVPTKKFKTTTISLRLQNSLKKETTTLRTLLTFVMVAATRKYPSSKDLARYLEENYGSRLSANISTKGKSQIINIHMSFVNDHFLLNQEHLLQKQVCLLHDIFFDPLIENQSFQNDIVQLKKKELKERLQVNRDDKFSYSLDKLFEYMGEKDTLGISSTGYEDEIDSFSAHDIYKYFLDVIENDNKHIYVVGDIDESIVPIFEKNLEFPIHQNTFESSYLFCSNRNDVLEIIEKQDVSQSKLNLGYTIPCDFKSSSHYAMTVFNALFGGFSQSCLFQVVREKNSLCYYISSSYDAFNGIMIVNAGIEANDYSKTIQLIQSELCKIANGEISDEQIILAKNMLKNALKKTDDEASGIIALAYNRDIVEKRETNEEYIEKLLNVTREEIVQIASKIKLDTIFFLTGKDFHEKN